LPQAQSCLQRCLTGAQNDDFHEQLPLPRVVYLMGALFPRNQFAVKGWLDASKIGWHS